MLILLTSVFAQGENQHSRKIHVAASGEKLICASRCKTSSFFGRRKEGQKTPGLAMPLKDFLDHAGKVGPYVMCRHRKLWVPWARE